MKDSILGVAMALLILAFWFSSLWVGLVHIDVSWNNPWVYVMVLLMTHLYTGVFITAHDAMHGTVSPKFPKLNHSLGFIATVLFAYNYYPKLYKCHHEHHKHPASDKDPDYHHSNRFWPWYASFLKQYLSIYQFILMGITFEVLRLYFPLPNLILFWVIPSILSTLQLFYFGTYRPHKNAPSNKHKASTLPTQHLWAFASCYFFGYHYEHHEYPYMPWWKLYQTKRKD